MAEILKFTYKKKNGEERAVELHELTNDAMAIEGLDLSKISADERYYLLELYAEYEDHVTYLMKKAYRRFLRAGIVDEIVESEPI